MENPAQVNHVFLSQQVRKNSGIEESLCLKCCNAVGKCCNNNNNNNNNNNKYFRVKQVFRVEKLVGR